MTPRISTTATKSSISVTRRGLIAGVSQLH